MKAAGRRGRELDDDMGLFGPGSMAWTMHREPAMLIGGLRALMVQALHPLAMAAVADFSDYKSDVWARYDRTSSYVTTTIFGSSKQALAAGRRVREVHRPIRGVDTVTGLPYSADDEELLLWVHAVLIDSFVAAYQRFVRRLPVADLDRYVGELVRQAELVGLEAARVPPTWAGNQEFLASLQPDLRSTPAALEALDTILHPPLPAWRRPFWEVAGRAAVSIMPGYAMNLYGLRRRPLLDRAVRPMVAHGSWAARVFLKPPPVLQEARRRAALRGQTL